jgi:hypothetical protein
MKHKLSPQKASAPNLLAFDKKQTKKGLSTPKKQTNERFNVRLSKLREVMPLCIVCDETVDTQNNSA